MNFKKKCISMVLAFFMLMINITPALAVAFDDVPTDYWAYEAIESVSNDQVMNGYKDNTFKPEGTVKRVDFTKMLLKAIGHDDIDIETNNIFQDLASGNYGYEDIMRTKQLGLVYGYPDKKFKPSQNITKAEVSSILSHITKGEAQDPATLDRFFDKNDVPNWAFEAYTKCVENNLYVNYPDENMLTPNRDATRAEIAVLLYKIRKAMNLVEDQYKGDAAPVEQKEYLIRTEHLNQVPEADEHIVQITNLRQIVLAKNIIKANFKQKFNSNEVKMGDLVEFDIPKNIYTDEGTLTFQAGTVLVAEVNYLEKPKMLNKSGAVGLIFKDMVLPSGQVVPFEGRAVETKDVDILKRGGWASAAKVAKFTAIGTAVGTVGGLAIGRMSTNDNNTGKGAIIGLCIGAGTGLLLGLITPGVPYKANQGDEIMVELTQDLSLDIAL